MLGRHKMFARTAHATAATAAAATDATRRRVTPLLLFPSEYSPVDRTVLLPVLLSSALQRGECVESPAGTRALRTADARP